TSSVADVACRFLSTNGIPFRRYEPFDGRVNVIAQIQRSGTGPHLHWNGHLDTFPGISTAADGVRATDGRIYGRGAVDMKAGVAAFLLAASEIHSQADWDLPGDISLSLVADEE